MLNVLPHIDLDLVRESAKPIIGYSDLSALLNLVAFGAGVVSFHGPMVLSEWGEAGGPWDFTATSFRKVSGMEGAWSEYKVPAAPDWSDEMLWWDRDDTRPRAPVDGGEQLRVVQAGDGTPVEGRLWGGSLVALPLALGTPVWEQPEDVLIFLEAEGMAPDEFAARIMQLSLSGVFKRAAGLVLGRMGQPRSCLNGFDDFDQVVRGIVPPGLPVAAGFDIGHTEPMSTLPVGGLARLDCALEVPTFSLIGPN
ncbi:hypothetical protein GCM10009612_72490 [Streptomyces beijiangensis]